MMMQINYEKKNQNTIIYISYALPCDSFVRSLVGFKGPAK